MNLPLAVLAGVLAGAGTYLVLHRSLTRILLGLALIGHAANLVLLLAGGGAGNPPLIGQPEPLADPLPQAMALTAIVITFGVIAFVLALAWRAWSETGTDLVEDDLEDRRIARMQPAPEDRGHR